MTADVNHVTFEEHFAEAVGAGLDPTHRSVYEAHSGRHADLQGTPEGRAQILDRTRAGAPLLGPDRPPAR